MTKAAARAVQLIENPTNGELICPLCKATFTSKLAGRRHIQSIHGGQKFRCEICQKEFNRKDAFKVHLQKVHSISGPTAQAMCETCDVS